MHTLCALAFTAMTSPPTFDAQVIGPPAGFESARPRAMSAGLIVGQASPLEDEYPIRALLSPMEGPAGVLPIASEVPDIAQDVNNDGLVVGTSSFQAVAWVDGEPVILTPEFLDLDGNFQIGHFGAANACNDAGLIVGHIDLGLLNQLQCVYWPSAESDAVILDGLGDPYSYGSTFDVNASSMIVGAVQEVVEGIFKPARWASPDAEAMLIEIPEGYSLGEAIALNELGDVVGRVSGAEGTSPFLYRDDTGEVSLLGQLEGAAFAFAEARDVNDARHVVGASNAGPGVAHAFLWIDGEMHDLNDLVEPIEGVLHLSDAVTILDDGRILAEGLVDDTPGAIRKTMVILTPSCAADVNGDGALNVLDFVAFQTLFVAGDNAADCDANGQFNVLDFVCFQQVQTGCG